MKKSPRGSKRSSRPKAVIDIKKYAEWTPMQLQAFDVFHQRAVRYGRPLTLKFAMKEANRLIESAQEFVKLFKGKR